MPFHTATSLSPSNLLIESLGTSSIDGTLDRSLENSVSGFDDIGVEAACHSVGTFDSGDRAEQHALSVLPSIATTPVLVRHSMEILLRVLRTWPRMLAKGTQTPPLIHESQVKEGKLRKSMANCFTLARMWDGQYPGAADIVGETIKKEVYGIMETVSFHFIPPFWPHA